MSENVYYWIGGACALIIVVQLVKNVVPWLWKNLVGPKMFGPRVNIRRMGQWAVITGATDGIGKSYAKALAKKGLNLILISRSKDKLTKVADEIKSTSPVQIQTIDVDFTQGPEIYEKIQHGIGNLEVGILINNVGMCYEYPEYFLDVPNSDKLFWNLIICNTCSVTYMTKLILPSMVARKKGVIMNIASLSGTMPNPLFTVYAATKAFVVKFTSDLNAEYKGKGITIQCILPGPVATKMATAIQKESFVAPNSDKYVASTLKSLGISSQTTGYFGHTLMDLSINIVKAVTCLPVAYSIMHKVMLKARSQALTSGKVQPK